MKADLNQQIKEYRQNSEAYHCLVTEEDYEKFEPKIQLLKRLSEVENSILTIFDMNRQNYLLKSSRFKEMLGYTKPEDIENDEMKLFHEIIHPDDLQFVLDTENKAHSFFNNLPASEKKDFKLVYDFRVKNTAGVYTRFMHQLVVLEQDCSGNSWLLLIVTDLISEKAQDAPPKRRMINIKTAKLFLFHDDDEFQSDTLLTKRETEVLRLISQGLDSQKISERLFISANTVNNHRQKILRKTRTDNTTQALLYTKKIGII